MANLLKAFGRGCLYILVLPVLLVILSVYIVLGVGMFIYIAIKGAILFFTGRNFGELPEDIKARAILEGRSEEIKQEEPKEEVKEEEVDHSNDYLNHYFIPLDQNTPTPKQEDFRNHIDEEEANNKEEGDVE